MTSWAELSRTAKVVVHGHRPPEEVATFVRDHADLGVVSLTPGVIAAAYPSKTMTYLRHGCPILALVEPDSELATMVEEARIGISASQRSATDAAGRAARPGGRPDTARRRAERARAVYDERFARERQLARWTELFAGLDACAVTRLIDVLVSAVALVVASAGAAAGGGGHQAHQPGTGPLPRSSRRP